MYIELNNFESVKQANDDLKFSEMIPVITF